MGHKRDMDHKPRKLLLLAGDLAVLHLALFGTLFLRYGKINLSEQWQIHWLAFLPVFVIWLLSLYINGLYESGRRPAGRDYLLSLLNATIAAATIAALYFYLNGNIGVAPKTNLAIFSVILLILFLAWRFLIQMAFRTALWQTGVALIGDNAAAHLLQDEIAKRSDYRLVTHIREETQLRELAGALKVSNAQAVVVADDFSDAPALSRVLFDCLADELSFYSYPDFYELLTGKVPVEAIGPDWFLANVRTGERRYYRAMKRTSDIIFAVLVLTISLPFWPFIALGIALSSRGSIFFRQLRLGREGQAFKIIKFRTMRQENNDHSPTRANDDRVTAFGSFLRRTRLDELPQTINILRGEMSFIGPRPERPELAAELERVIPFYRTRLLIKPGLTGWDQISGDYHSASPSDTLAKLQHDLYYLKHRSLYLDMSIALKTLATMMSREGR